MDKNVQVENSNFLLHELIAFNEFSEETAIAFYDDAKKEEKTIPYKKLHRISTELAKDLDELTKHRSCTVGILCDYNEILPILLVSVLKANCCFVYLPLRENVEYLRNWTMACEIRLILSFELNWKEYVPDYNLKSRATVDELCVDIIQSQSFDESIHSSNDDEKIAYIMRTSGTTGPFKKVRVPHSAIVPNIVDFTTTFEVNRSDIVFLASPLTFDPSIVEMFVAFSAGAKLLIVPERSKLEPRVLSEILFEKYAITILQMTPSLFSRIIQKALSAESFVRVLALGGEAFPFKEIISNRSEKNRTRLFNVYGITEVSCWATCAKISLEDLTSGEIPLGRPILDTELKFSPISDQDETTGTLLIGGKKRTCFVDAETRITAPEFRSTGDLVRKVGENRFVFVGRLDCQVKRFGKVINLEQIAKIVRQFANVSEAYCIMDDVVLFAALKLVGKSGESSKCNEDFVMNLRQYISSQLPTYSVPDEFVIVDEFPLTEHGKADKKSLVAQLRSSVTAKFDSSWHSLSKDDIFSTLVSLNLLGAEALNDFSDEKFLWQLGCDSVKALQLVAKLETYLRKKLPLAFEFIVFKPVGDLCAYLEEEVQMANGDEQQQMSNFRKRSLSNGSLSEIAKDTKVRRNPASTMESSSCSSKIPTSNFRVIRRANVVSLLNEEERIALKFRSDKLQMKVRWTWNSGKCIDASPVLIEEKGICSVFIGSHSGKFGCFNACNGQLNWMRDLGERIEATAQVTHCGRFVVLGCYDTSLYFLGRKNGETHFAFKTGDIIKCSPCVSSKSFEVYFGSHDGYFYALNYEEKLLKWKIHLSSAVVCTPCLNESEEFVYVATLSGLVTCVLRENGSKIWTIDFSIPIFASLTLVKEILFVTCVDGRVSFVSPLNGEVIGVYDCCSPIFNSSCFVASDDDGRFFIFGAQNGFVYCCDFGGSLRWTIAMESAISSSPFLFPAIVSETSIMICCICSKNGTVYLLDSNAGRILHQYSLNGEVFSSPVVWRNCVYVGCRNDQLYCLELSDV